MPEPWPELKSPEEAPATLPLPERKRRSFPRSRFALAASIAILLTGGWLLSGSLKDGPGNGTVKQPTNGEATLPRVRDLRLVQPRDGSTEIRMILDQVPQQPKKVDARDQLNDQLP
jgi:hypothetical protein